MLFRRAYKLSGVREALYILNTRTLAGRRTAHAIANLRCIHIKFCQCAAQRVAVHAQSLCCLALIALVLGEHFKDVAPLELAESTRLADPGAMHP